MFYLTLILGLVFAFFIKDQIKSAKVYTVLLILLAAFRYGIGADYFAYQYLYKQIKLFVIPEIIFGYEKQEVGFRALGSLIKTFGFSYQMYLAILATITLYFIYRISVEYSKNPMLSMVVYYAFYYFVWTYSGLRQGLAMAVGMYFLLNAIAKNEKKQFYLVSLILFTIHSSSLVLLLMYFMVTYIPWSKKGVLVALGLSILFAFIPMGDVIHYLSRFTGVFERLSPYMDQAFTLRDLFGFQVIPRLALMGLVLYYYQDLVESSPVMKKMVLIYLMSFAFYFIFQFSELTAARISIYGRILDLILLPNLLALKVPKLEKKVFFVGLIMLLSLYLVKEVGAMKDQAGLITEQKYLVPYSSIFNKDDMYYNTYYYYILYYGATEGTPHHFHMIQ